MGTAHRTMDTAQSTLAPAGKVWLGRKIEASEFEEAALPHLNDLYRTALRLVRNPGDAEDLVQEAYLEAWKSFHRFEPGTNCRAWLFKILFHRVQHHRRRWFNMLKWIKEDEEIREDAIEYLPPIPEHLSDEDVLRALDKIPEDFREVILLADVQEFSYKEIAETLHIPLGTVMSRLSRGRRLLRSELAEFARALGMKAQLNEGQST